MASQVLALARRIALGATSGLTGFAAYRSLTDPVHLFWDLDYTILCSVHPIPADIDGPVGRNENPASGRTISPSGLASLVPAPPPLRHFDQVDDDFPYDIRTPSPNTRTYFRPGARMALRLCSRFGVLHVFTAAQESYTNNILKELDPDGTVFVKVLHRDAFPQIVREGKDLSLGANDMRRAILFDDRPGNFRPQGYENGITVLPFTPDRVERCHDGSWGAYLEEVGEMLRLVGIALWSTAHFSGDVRKVVKRVRGWRDPSDLD